MRGSRVLDHRTGGGSLAIATAIAFAALACVTAPCSAVRICDYCTEANDTSFTPGTVSLPDLIVAQAMAPPIAFIGADRMLRCAVPALPGWQIETVDPGSMAGGCAIEVDPTLGPMIGYHDANGMLLWAHRLGTGWLREPIDPNAVVTGSTAIARVPGGRVGIAYVDASTATLKYAERSAAGVWSNEFVAPAGGSEAYPSLIVDGTVRAISYYDAVAGDLRLALSQEGTTWNTQLVDGAGDVGGYSSLVGRPSLGQFGVAYYDFTNADLLYAHSVPGGWAVEPVDVGPDSVGRFCSAVALGGDPSDLVGIGYYDQTHGNLKYAVRSGTWTSVVLDTAGDVGGSVACGATSVPEDTVGIAYLDRATGHLYYRWGARTVTAVPTAVVESERLRVEWLRSLDGAGGRIRFDVPRTGHVRVALYDAQGRLMAVPLRTELLAGRAEVKWDGRDERGVRLRAGVYFVGVETVGGAGTTAAVLLR